MRSYIDIDVRGVRVFGQYETSFTLDQEEDIIDVITFKIDVVLIWERKAPQQRTDPRDESRRPTFEAINSFVGLLMDI